MQLIGNSDQFSIFFEETPTGVFFKVESPVGKKLIKYELGNIHKEWLVNIDEDKESELLIASGYEDGIDYYFADIDLESNQIIPLLYVTPIRVSDGKYTRVSGTNICDLPTENGKFNASLIELERDDSFSTLPTQNILPTVVFEGVTNESELPVKIDDLKLYSLHGLIKNVSQRRAKGIDGIWRKNCDSKLSILDISDDQAYMLIHSNTIAINCDMVSTSPTAFDIIYSSIDVEIAPEYDFKSDEIKKERVASVVVNTDSQLVMTWYGLKDFNEKVHFEKAVFGSKNDVIVWDQCEE